MIWSTNDDLLFLTIWTEFLYCVLNLLLVLIIELIFDIDFWLIACIVNEITKHTSMGDKSLGLKYIAIGCSNFVTSTIFSPNNGSFPSF